MPLLLLGCHTSNRLLLLSCTHHGRQPCSGQLAIGAAWLANGCQRRAKADLRAVGAATLLTLLLLQAGKVEARHRDDGGATRAGRGRPDAAAAGLPIAA